MAQSENSMTPILLLLQYRRIIKYIPLGLLS